MNHRCPHHNSRPASSNQFSGRSHVLTMDIRFFPYSWGNRVTYLGIKNENLTQAYRRKGGV